MTARLTTLIAFSFSIASLYGQQINLSGMYGFTNNDVFPRVYGVKAAWGGYLSQNFHAEAHLGYNNFFESMRGEPPHDQWYVTNFRRSFGFGLTGLFNIYSPPGPGRIMMGAGVSVHYIEYRRPFMNSSLVLGTDITFPLVYRVDRFDQSRWGAFIGAAGSWWLMEENNNYSQNLNSSKFTGLNVQAGVVYNLSAPEPDNQ